MADDEIARRFPQLANFDDMDDAQRIRALQNALDQLSRELDEGR